MTSSFSFSIIILTCCTLILARALLVRCSTTTNRPQSSPSQPISTQESIDDILRDTLSSLDGLDRKLAQVTNKTRNASIRDHLRKLEQEQQASMGEEKERQAMEELTRLADKFSSERNEMKSHNHEAQLDNMATQASSLSSDYKKERDNEDQEATHNLAQVLGHSARKLRQLNSSSSNSDNSDFTNRHIQFSLDLMQALFASTTQPSSETGSKLKSTSSQQGNQLESFLISPVSIQVVLMMLHLGARGQTKRELASCLHLPAPFDSTPPIRSANHSPNIEPQKLAQPTSTTTITSNNKLRRRNPAAQHQQTTNRSASLSSTNQHNSSPATTTSAASANNNVHELFGAAMKNLLKDPAVVKSLTSASQIFLQRHLSLLTPYEQAVRHYYGVEFKSVDFQQQANELPNSNISNSDATTNNMQHQQSAEQPVHLFINDWIEKQTRGKISNFLQSSLPTSTLLMAINVLFFKGDWQYKFDPADTDPDAWFTLANGQTVKLPMMVNKLPLAHAYDPQMKTSVIELPYKAQRLGLFVLLPDEADGIYHTMRQLNSTTFANLISMMRKSSSTQSNPKQTGGDGASISSSNALTGINVRIPKFNIESSPRLSQILSQQLGLKSLFSSDVADLSGMFGRNNCNIHLSNVQRCSASNSSSHLAQVGLDELMHKAVLQVHEQGSVAAAASATIVERVGLFNGQYFEADHPFLVFLMDKQTGLVLFSGVFAGPTSNNPSGDHQQSSPSTNTNG